MLHRGDPARERMAAERMRHPPASWNADIRRVLTETIRECEHESPWRVLALAVVESHLHLLINYSGLDVDRTAKWIAQRMTKAVRRDTPHEGPVFCKGKWCGFIFDEMHLENTRNYIIDHLLR